MDFIKIIEKNYDLKVLSLNTAPRGFVAETYIVQTNNAKYFVKIFSNPHFMANITSSLPIQFELCRMGIDFITCPIKTHNGNFFARDTNRIFAVYNFIPGFLERNFDKSEVFRLLAEIYLKTETVLNLDIPAENFDIPFPEMYLKYTEYYFSGHIRNEAELQISKYLMQYRSFLLTSWNELLQISKFCKTRNTRYYLTHSDVPGNVMRYKNKTYIVDWDEVILAPIERDSWFHISNAREKTMFLNAMEDKGIDYHIDLHYYKFYVYKRFFEDLTGYLEAVELSDNNNIKYEMLVEIKRVCFDWLYNLMLGLDK